jgi:hypothetical protein
MNARIDLRRAQSQEVELSEIAKLFLNNLVYHMVELPSMEELLLSLILRPVALLLAPGLPVEQEQLVVVGPVVFANRENRHLSLALRPTSTNRVNDINLGNDSR